MCICPVSILPWVGHPGKLRRFHEVLYIDWRWNDNRTSFGTVGWSRAATFSLIANYPGATLGRKITRKPDGTPVQLSLF